MYQTIVALAAALCLMGATVPQATVSSEITFCSFEFPENLKQANLSFYVSYSFELDADGVPIRFLKLRNEYVQEDQVVSCLKNWRFSGLRKGAKLVVTFRWKHGEGWVQLAIVGPRYKQIVRANPSTS